MNMTSSDPLALPSTNAPAAVDDRRTLQRVSTDVASALVGLHSAQTIECTVCDVSESGLFLHAAANSGIRVGQRFEVTIGGDASPVGLAASLRDGCYATVVRTAQVSSTTQRLLGAGLRFDQPLLG